MENKAVKKKWKNGRANTSHLQTDSTQAKNNKRTKKYQDAKILEIKFVEKNGSFVVTGCT